MEPNSDIPPSVEPPPVPPPSPAPSATMDPSTEKNLAMLCHLLALSGLLIPLGSVIGPLVLWLLKKDSSAMIDSHGKESLNFQITVGGAILICMATFWLFVPILIAFVIGIAAIVLTIIGAIKASNGEFYRYPFTLRLVK